MEKYMVPISFRLRECEFDVSVKNDCHTGPFDTKDDANKWRSSFLDGVSKTASGKAFIVGQPVIIYTPREEAKIHNLITQIIADTIDVLNEKVRITKESLSSCKRR